MPSNTDTTASLEALKNLGVPRVWSLLVSIFGELAQDTGDRIEGPVLTRLTDGMDIKPEAVRVALHRLRNDNWISSVKSGRTASHALTPSGLKQRDAAAPLIYNAHANLPNTWQIALPNPNETAQKEALIKAGFVQIIPRAFVAHGAVMPPSGVLCAQGQTAPEWCSEALMPADLTTQFSTLLTVLQTVRHRVSSPGALSPQDAAVLRCLVVHHWRRLVLRHPYLPPSLIGETWPGHQCRTVVVGLLQALPRPNLSQLSAD